MSKNLFLVFAFALLGLSSCKKDDATAKIDASTEAIPPASADAVILNEPTVQAPEPEPAKAEVPVDGKYPQMAFGKNEHDFGTIKEGDKPEYTFTFENNGEADLVIKDAKGSCGCTVPEYPKEPIKPGEKGKIKVSFNSAGKPGQQHKTVTITTNTKSGTEKLSIKATVTPKQS